MSAPHRLYQHPGIAATVNMDHIKRRYYMTHGDINPSRIVPLGPELDFTRPHGRERLQDRAER
jgi:putative glutathione S-transferase